MAQGTFTLFNAFKESIGTSVIDLSSDTFKLAFISTVPAATDADPRWGAGGSTNLSSNEVSGTNYTTGGNTLASPTYSESSGTATWDTADPTTWSQNASGPTDIKTGIVYDDTDAGKRAIGFIDMTTDSGTTAISLAASDITVTVNASGWFTLS